MASCEPEVKRLITDLRRGIWGKLPAAGQNQKRLHFLEGPLQAMHQRSKAQFACAFRNPS